MQITYERITYDKYVRGVTGEKFYVGRLPLKLIGKIGDRPAKINHRKAQDAVDYVLSVVERFQRMKNNGPV